MRKKKVLIISYYWPPAGGISVLRSLKIAKYLSDYNWEPVVYTLANPNYPMTDDSNFRHIPKDLVVLRKSGMDFLNLYKNMTGRKKKDPLFDVLNTHDKKPTLLHHLAVWIRSNFFIPDARYLWINPSVKFLLDYLKSNAVDAIFSDGPPHTNTRIACLISQKTGIPWLADFQDPWTQVDYYQLLYLTKWADKIHRKQEEEAFRQASKITIVSKTWKKDLESIGAKNVSVIPWGYDDDDFTDITYQSTHTFMICHIGLLGKDRLPETFIKAVAELCRENDLFRSHLDLRFIGAVDFSLKEIVKKENIAEHISFIEQISRADVLKLTASSQIQLLLLNKATNALGRVPGKLFEYLRAKRMIICLGPSGSDVEQIIDDTQSGISIEYEDLPAIKFHLLKAFDQYIKNGSTYIDQVNLEKYSIKKLTGEIAGFLNEITDKNAKK